MSAGRYLLRDDGQGIHNLMMMMMMRMGKEMIKLG